MADIIQLLPDSVANQIAAGEVIQRPASVVKELLENSIDAKSTSIKLIVKDAGKTLVQVIDNGIGMSDTDARMCFERHATSKIREANDLFALHTMGFRGEAMASIAAIAQISLKTKRKNEELGTEIIIEGSVVKKQEVCSTENGTNIAIKNLFYNVPARRKFLKSDKVELRHIIDEFERVALANPEIQMEFYHNNNELFHLEQGSFRQRIVGVFGKSYNEKLVPVEEETDIVKISGFIGKPEAARKTRGEQFFFANGRFIKSPYLHHAVQSAFEDLIQKGDHPSYFLNLSLDPKSIDINIHPTKTEIKFEDEKAVYSIIRAAVKQSLGQYNIAPTLDFETEQAFALDFDKNKPISIPTITVDPTFNPFDSEKKSSNSTYTKPLETEVQKSNKLNWNELYEGLENMENQLENSPKQETISSNWDDEPEQKLLHQLNKKYILTQTKSGLIVIHQTRAHQRILYEKYIQNLAMHTGTSQQQLFPVTISFSPSDAEILNNISNEIQTLGFDIENFGNNDFIVRGLPSEVENNNPKELLDAIIEQFKTDMPEIGLSRNQKIAKTLAYNTAIKQGKKLHTEEMSSLIDELFACEKPYSSPSGKPTIISFTIEDLDNQFE